MSATDPGKPSRPVAGRTGSGLAIVAILLALGVGVLVWGRINKENAGVPGAIAQLGGSNFTENQRQSIEGIVKEYMLAHPELLIDMQQALETKMAKEEAERTKKLVASHAKELYRNADDPVAGNADGDIAVVEFFDYNCGYCKRGFSGVAELIKKDKNVRFVFKDLPIIRNESEGASRVALAAKLKGKYWELHRALIQHKGTTTEAVALKAAEDLGLDMEKLKADANSKAVKKEIEDTKKLAQKMGINGTPHFLVGDRAVGGAPENLYELLEKHVTELRQSGCNYC